MAYQASGTLHKIFDTEQKSASFQAREFVIEVPDDKYPQMVKFQLVQDKCALVDEFSEGDEVTVDFDLRGREWNGKYFTNLQAWRVAQGGSQSADASASAGASASGAPASSGQPARAGTAPASSTAATADFDDDIPF